MVNKRKLIELILSTNYSENTYFDIKEAICLSSVSQKGKLLKHICALSNSNPNNDSFLIFGVEDETLNYKGVEYRDDSIVQNLVFEYLDNPPRILYENVVFPELQERNGSQKFIGLLTIYENGIFCKFKKNIWKIRKEQSFGRLGSQTRPIREQDWRLDTSNVGVVSELERMAATKLEDIVNGIFRFYQKVGESYAPHHVVLHDIYVVCYSGWVDKINDESFLSEANIELIGENVQLFYSACEHIQISTSDNKIEIVKYVCLHFNEEMHYFPFESKAIVFSPASGYEINDRFIFNLPKISKREAASIVQRYKKVHKKIGDGLSLNELTQEEDMKLGLYCDELLVSFFNGNKEAGTLFENYLHGQYDGAVAESYTDARDILEACRREKIFPE